MSDVFNYMKIQAYNDEKFEGIIDINANIGDEMSIKNPKYDKVKAPDEPQRLYYYPIKVGLVNYLLDSDSIQHLPIKIIESQKITVSNKGYEKIIRAVPVSIKAQKTMEYRDYINQYMNYEHMVPMEWIVWKIICERSIADNMFIRAISYPSWGKTSTFYVMSLLRNDIEILDNNTYARMKYSLSAKPKVLVFDEVDDITTETQRSLSKAFRNCGDGRGRVTNDTRASSGVAEVFDLESTSIVALSNFPSTTSGKFFDTNFHPKIRSRLFPLLLDGGDHNISPMLTKHKHERKHITRDEKAILDDNLKNSKHYELHWYAELEEAGKLEWKPRHVFKDTRWSQTYETICNGLKLYADTEEIFHKLEEVLYRMHNNYLQFTDMYESGDIHWISKVNQEPQKTLQQIEEEIL